VPGVPDIYQGAELWDFSMVDPDNRRAVDFEKRDALLNDVEAEGSNALRSEWTSGKAKLFIQNRILSLRSANVELFNDGSYTPLETDETNSRYCAYVRSNSEAAYVVIANLGLEETSTKSTVSIPAELRQQFCWEDALSGRPVDLSSERVAVAPLHRDMPFCILSGTRRSYRH
jgi:(1->4)-alpha-D-glucan 1-alpha-D-glucosylmutase